MSDPDNTFAHRFIAAARAQIIGYDERQQEVEQLIERELNKRDRWINLFIAFYGLVGVAVLLVLAVRADKLPWYPVIPAFFYLALATMVVGGVAVHLIVVIRGRYSETERAAKADWTMWCVVILVNMLFIWWFIHPDIKEKTYFAVGAVAGLVIAVAESLRRQLRLVQRKLQENSLKTELRFAELMERMTDNDTAPGSGQRDVRER
jgi:hypothetical protein